MSIEAYVFIKCEHARAKQVYDRVSTIEGVQRVNIVTGPYDIIAIVSAPDFKALGQLVISSLQSESFVMRTMTNVIVE